MFIHMLLYMYKKGEQHAVERAYQNIRERWLGIS